MGRLSFCVNGHLAERNDFGRCKECQREADKRWRERHPKKALKRARDWDRKNPERRRENARNSRARKSELINQKQREWRAKNPDKTRIYLRTYFEKNRELFKRLNEKWKALNPDKVRTMGRRGQAARRACMPKWADRTAIKAIYDKCPVGHHVDHVLPIKGKNVCGLHVPENLQYLPAIENIKKGNRVYLQSVIT